MPLPACKGSTPVLRARWRIVRSRRFLTYAAPGGHALIDRELYLPESWTSDAARCAAAGIQGDVTFATKLQLAEMLTFLAGWLSGSQQPTLAQSLADFVGHRAYGIEALRADLHRFVFLLGVSDGQELFGEPTP